jgi:hypothetical protein
VVPSPRHMRQLSPSSSGRFAWTSGSGGRSTSDITDGALPGAGRTPTSPSMVVYVPEDHQSDITPGAYAWSFSEVDIDNWGERRSLVGWKGTCRVLVKRSGQEMQYCKVLFRYCGWNAR